MNRCTKVKLKLAVAIFAFTAPLAVPGYGIVKAMINTEENIDIVKAYEFSKITFTNAYRLTLDKKNPFELYNSNFVSDKIISLKDADIIHTLYPDRETIDYIRKRPAKGNILTGMHSFVRKYDQKKFIIDPNSGGLWKDKDDEKECLEDAIKMSKKYFNKDLQYLIK